MTRAGFHRTVAAAALAAAVLLPGSRLPASPAWVWELPPGVATPPVPADHPMSPALVELGRHLFYDTRLSANDTQSCATCHQQTRAFTDGRRHGLGSTGEPHVRNSMSLVNVAYAETLTWAHPTLTSLEDQALVPMFGTAPVELGRREADTRWLDRLAVDPVYARLVPAALSGASRLTVSHVTRALAAFERSIVSMRSPWDRYHASTGTTRRSRRRQDRGGVLFHSRAALRCFTCHGGLHFSGCDECRPPASSRTQHRPLQPARGAVVSGA
ncbi:MAG: cytochrome-c peroxidase [Vicinamibacterales bacterium]